MWIAVDQIRLCYVLEHIEVSPLGVDKGQEAWNPSSSSNNRRENCILPERPPGEGRWTTQFEFPMRGNP